MSGDQSAHQEIVIVRRRGGEEEGHHGGAWKIAYADFMTAMMAFFLVMWLVNAADKKVLTQVASYFNPLRMSDRVTARKGIEDMTEGAEDHEKSATSGVKKDAKADTAKEKKAAETGESKDPKKKEEADAESGEKSKPAPGGKTHLTEQELFNDPYGILEKLAAEAAIGPQGGSEANSGTGTDQAGGEAFRDPFDPDFNRQLAKVPVPLGEPEQKTPPQDVAAADPAAVEAMSSQQSATLETPKNATETSLDKSYPPAPAEKAAVELQAKLEAAMREFAPGQRPGVSVKSTDEGLLVSLTDEFDFEMFGPSSAVPDPQLVAAMRKIGGVLKPLPGTIVVRGHTDTRAFKKGTSDNWRLSAQRALMARYMLVNGGVDEKRLERVEGYADTMLRVKSDGLAAQNRRIEVLLRRKNGG